MNIQPLKKIKRKGFTLLEILISITLMSILIITLFSSISSIQNTHSKIKDIGNLEKDVYFFYNYISKLFKNMSSVIVNNNIKKSYYFLGQKHEITFVSKSPVIFPYYVPHFVNLRINEGKFEYKEKIFLESGIKPVSFDFDDATHEVLLEDIRNGEISYYILDSRDNNYIWVKQVDTFKDDPMPIKVKFTFSIENRDYEMLFNRFINEQ
jgi:prepilin-type N-terminal cleavage/methylation domain-containing protein